MSSVNRPVFVPEMNDRRLSAQVQARAGHVVAARSDSAAVREVFEGLAPDASDEQIGRRLVELEQARKAARSVEQDWSTAHPDETERIQARRDADAVYRAYSQDIDAANAAREAQHHPANGQVRASDGITTEQAEPAEVVRQETREPFEMRWAPYEEVAATGIVVRGEEWTSTSAWKTGSDRWLGRDIENDGFDR